MWYFHIILILFMCCHAFGDEQSCFTHDFGNDFSQVFSVGNEVCGSMNPWVQENSNSFNIDQFHPYGNYYVRPHTSFSCIYSLTFKMGGGGKLEFNVYMNPTLASDQIRILAYERGINTDIIVGEYTGSLAYNNFVVGWNTFVIDVNSNSDIFDGYVAIVARAASNTAVLIDSFRYIPPELLSITEVSNDNENTQNSQGDMTKISKDDNEICPIYPPIRFECIDYDFRGYDLLFDNSLEVCTNTEPWEAVTIDEFDDREVYGIRPKVAGTPSCTSTPSFPVPGSGVLEVKIMVQSELYFDSVLVAMNDDKDINHFATYNKWIHGNGWHTLKVELKDIDEEYRAQITFVGFATEGSTVLIESFRFTPSAWNEGECKSLINTRKWIDIGN